MASFPRDDNRIPVIGGVSDASGLPIAIEADAVNSSLKVTIAADDAGIGGGTQYTEDDAAAANPLGNAQMLIRTDTPSTQVSADGDNVARRGTNYGAALTQIVTSSGSFVDSFGGGTEYTEDDAAAANPIGNAQILVRSDTPATIASADGDNVARRGTNYGAALTQIVTSSGSFVDTFGGGTQYAVDAVAGASDTGTLALAVRDDTTTTLTPVDGDYTQLRTDSQGHLWVSMGTQLDNLQDNVGAALQTDVIMNNTTALTPKFAVISASTFGDNTLIAAVASAKIRVLALNMVLAAATTIRFESGASGTALTGQMSIAANSGLVLPFNPVGWFETAANTLLNLELSAANQASGSITYVEV